MQFTIAHRNINGSVDVAILWSYSAMALQYNNDGAKTSQFERMVQEKIATARFVYGRAIDKNKMKAALFTFIFRCQY